MSHKEAIAFWSRSRGALAAAKQLQISGYVDSSLSRSYYAAFHAISAFFASEDRYFTRHSAVSTAVHRDLVHSGKWPQSLGGDYDQLMEFRRRGDYDVLLPLSDEEAQISVAAAERILQAVHELNPGLFPLEP